MTDTLSPELLHKMHAYWRAANYLSVGQIYLHGQPVAATSRCKRGARQAPPARPLGHDARA